MTPDNLILLNEEIAAMARAGLPLDQGLAALAQEMGRGRLRQVTAQLADDLRAGQTLPEALQRQGNRVPPFYAGLVEAGVRSGRVAEVLATLTDYARTVAGLRATVIDAVLYPAVVLVFSGAILTVLVVYLVPQYGELFRQFGMSLPAVTEAVLAVCRRPGAFVAAPILAVLGALILTRAALGGTERGRCAWARAVYALPIIGTLIRSARLAAFTDLLAILVDYGLPLPRAFQLAGQASSDPFLTRGARLAKADLEAGLPVGPALREHLQVPELIVWMTATGQQRGDLGKMLHQVAELYRRQTERRAVLLKTVLPPFLIVVTGGVLVGLFVVALIWPVVRLLGELSKP
jgi:type II secretory pathway component PulF